MPISMLPFEKTVVELRDRLREARLRAGSDGPPSPELTATERDLRERARAWLRGLTPMQRVQLSRNAHRPTTREYIDFLFSDFIELSGDRRYSNDPAILAGLGTFRGRSVAVVGHQKGRGAKDSVYRNFGMPHPEGYRKAERIYDLADRFQLPLITFVNTPGAYPGIGAEERGQSEAIGSAIAKLCKLRVPVVAAIVGEGGSGGALALAVGNRVLMQEYAYYSVISPEGCAAILFGDGKRRDEAAASLKLTAEDLLGFEVIDRIVDEPIGGAQRDPEEASRVLGQALFDELVPLEKLQGDELVRHREERFRRFGNYVETGM